VFWITLNKILTIISVAEKIALLVISEQETESVQRGGKGGNKKCYIIAKTIYN